MTKDDLINIGLNKKKRLALYEKHQPTGLIVKKTKGRRIFLTPFDLANCIMALKNELKELRLRVRAMS